MYAIVHSGFGAADKLGLLWPCL